MKTFAIFVMLINNIHHANNSFFHLKYTSRAVATLPCDVVDQPSVRAGFLVMEKELWLPIVGYSHLYEVSNYGNIKAVQKISKVAHYYRLLKENIRVLQLNKYGYPVVALSKEGKKKLFGVHRLVAEAFIPNPENKPQVNHIDGNKQNNHVSNIEWCTHSENQSHRFESLGHVGHDRLLSSDQVFQILSATDYSHRARFSILFNVDKLLIKNVRVGKNYKKEYRDFCTKFGKPKFIRVSGDYTNFIKNKKKQATYLDENQIPATLSTDEILELGWAKIGKEKGAKTVKKLAD